MFLLAKTVIGKLASSRSFLLDLGNFTVLFTQRISRGKVIFSFSKRGLKTPQSKPRFAHNICTLFSNSCARPSISSNTVKIFANITKRSSETFHPNFSNKKISNELFSSLQKKFAVIQMKRKPLL